MDDAEKERRARRIMQAQTGFFIHAAVFALVMSILLAVNIGVSKDWWVQWPALGWGIGLAGHAVLVFGSMPRRTHDWQERRVQAIKSKL